MAYAPRFGKLVRLHNRMNTVVRNPHGGQQKEIPVDKGELEKPVAWRIGGRYNWKGQRERLVYLGRNWSGNGFWHQFEKVDKPGTIWCEVLDADLSNFEETGINRAKAAASLEGANDGAAEGGKA